jgi:glycerate kinase
MRVLVAPDKFRGTLTAEQAARAMAEGWRRADPAALVEAVPMADGGEGTLDALLAALGGERLRTVVRGPLGDPVEAEYGMVRTGAGDPTAIVEMARASGLQLLGPGRRDPTRATTYGTGELALEACRRGARTVVVCIGGSATTDGGAGMAQALGARLLDARGRNLGPGGGALLELARVDVSDVDPAVGAASFVVATDVDNPLVGPSGAAAVYGPQKGATPGDIVELDRALRHYAAVLHRDLGIDVRELPGAGAAGGLGGGLVAFLGARLRQGVEVVSEAVGLERRIEGADVVVTGEGSFDRQSLRGKTVAGVLRLAALAGRPAFVLCGRSEAGLTVEGATVRSLAERFGLDAARARAGALLADLAAEVAGERAGAARG